MDLTEQFKHHPFINWFIIAAVTGVDITEAMKRGTKDITMQVNGDEVDPLRALTRLEEEFDRMIEIRASELIEDLKRDILTPFEDKVDEIRGELDKMLTDKILQGRL